MPVIFQLDRTGEGICNILYGLGCGSPSSRQHTVQVDQLDAANAPINAHGDGIQGQG